MKKSERLLELLQALRRRRHPVAGKVLAEEMGVTLRTLYRDVDALRALGAAISGEAGIGYQLDKGFFMPPMMLNAEEVEALVLGLRMVIYGPDRDMAAVAQDVRAKIADSMPDDMRDLMDGVGLFALPNYSEVQGSAHLSTIRTAIRNETELKLDYVDRNDQATTRTVWPISLGYIGNRQMLQAWCTLRGDFRSFWIDRMKGASASDKRYPKPRRTLAYEWRQKTGMGDLQ
ncbi:MAG: YafY family transcriptional regulator [Hyphomicrobiaceae bacterium]|nr:YafY family transcriptional regulator [Hyphomicrobiaceae bacterium]MCC0023783.1 YafY family transcriptional regulator [Hyphomicrobiaceae bacterium]